MSLTRRKWISDSAFAALAASLSSCGTLLYPERRGQPAGRLDWKVVLLDGIGLLFFFIPGVIAFAVDFLNGTIYLPAECMPVQPPYPAGAHNPSETASPKTSQLVPVKLPRSQLTPAGIEKVIAKQTGKTVSLEEGNYVTRKMKTIDEFWETRDQFDTHSLGRPAPLS